MFYRELTKHTDRDDYYWGSRLYRTAYSPTCSDQEFDNSGNIVSPSDDKPEQQLWERL